MRRLSAIGAVGVLALAGTGVARSASPVFSPNWSGYVAAAPAASTVSFTRVSATWTEPTVVCRPGVTSAAAVWVGIGGYLGPGREVEQVGTDADCQSGKPTYYAWFELAPYPLVRIRLKVLPGDVVTGSVHVLPRAVRFQIANRTRRWTFRRTITWGLSDTSSAEWIVEAPARCVRYVCRRLPLANFGSVTMSALAATGNAATDTLACRTWSVVPIRLGPDATSPTGTAGAVPEPFAEDGSAFTVSWIARAPSG